jgi:hypothetical protein
MSYNLIRDAAPFTSPILPFMDAKFDNIRCKNNSADTMVANNITTNNVNTAYINGVMPPAFTPGLDKQFLATNVNTIQWEYFQLGSMSQALGTADSVLVTNNTATQAAWSKDLSLDSVDILDADGIKLAGVAAGANQTIASDGLGNLSWQPLGGLPVGPNNTVYITDGLGVQQWSNNVITDDVTVTNQFNSVNDTNLDNVNIVSSLDIAGISPTAGQVLGTDVGNVLGWQSLPQEQKKSLYFCTASQNINFALTTTLTYVPGYNNLFGMINQTAPSNFTCIVPGTYMIQADVSVLPSASENEISIRINGIPAGYGFLNVVSSFTSALTIVSLALGDIVQVYSERTNADPTPKLNLANISSSPILFTRLA